MTQRIPIHAPSAIPTFANYNSYTDRYHVEIDLRYGKPGGEHHNGVALTPSRATVLAATHWVCQYEPDVAEAIRMVDEVTARADSLGLGMCAYDTNDIKALLLLVRGEPAK